MNDLTFALRAAVDHATADRDPLPASPVLSRIHRRRTVRYASQGAVGLAAAGAAVVGGMQVAGRAPEPSPAATGLAEAMTVSCGAAIDDYAQPDGAPQMRLSLDASEADMVEPADAEIPFFVLADAPPETLEQAGTTLTFALIDDGVVVGMPAAGWSDDAGTGFGADGDPRQLIRWLDVPFAACQPDGSVTGSLAPGTYAVVAFLVPDEPTDWPIPFRSSTLVLHLGDPLGEATQRPALDTLVISTDGVGPVRLGEAPPADGPSPVVEWLDDGCLTFDEDGEATESGRWAATYSWRTTPYGTSTEPFGLAVANGLVTRIEVVTDGLATDAGVQVGDALDDVRAAYPDATLIGHVGPSGAVPGRDVWAVVGSDRLLAFEVTTDEPASGPQFDIGPGTVAAIVVGLGATYPEGTAALGVTCD